MSRWIRAILVLLLTTIALDPAFAGPSGCGLPTISGSRELQQFLSLRAVEVVRLAASSDKGLAALVDPSASFSIGSGDVGRPLGTGVNGARSLAQAMRADTYRFLGWDYMDMQADPCSKSKVEVEFIDSHGKSVYKMDFTFEAGRVLSAEGWERSFETGSL
jgi:hypothetical protein